ncbi:MAG: flagellar basal body-associated FliL family protein [Gemmatimonadaceae bacterium]|nr:flagellar basal body-associated FliL family protein [Gemmatimonadaceae bacterium]
MSDAPAAEPAAAPEASRKGALVPILAAVLVGLGAGGASGAFVAGPMLAARVIPPVDTLSLARQLEAGGDPSKAAHGEEDAAHGEGEEAAADEEHGGEEKPAKGEGKEGAVEAPIALLDNIVMNPSGAGGQRFLLLSVAYQLKNPDAQAKLKSHDAEIRDLVQRVVGMRTIEQLSDLTQRDQLKAEVAKATEEVIGKKSVKKVFFPQFVIQ